MTLDKEIVRVADQCYPPVSGVAVGLPTAREVAVSASSGPAGARSPRVRTTYRPRASEVSIDPQLRRPAVDHQVVGAAGTVSGRLAQGPVPLGAASPHREEVNVVSLPDPAAPGRYPGPEIGRRLPAGRSRDFCVVGGAGSVDALACAELDVLAAAVLPVADVYLVPPAPADVPGRYAGPEPAANHGLRPARVEILPPVVDVRVADQVMGNTGQRIEVNR
jgi:hypothetical protein